MNINIRTALSDVSSYSSKGALLILFAIGLLAKTAHAAPVSGSVGFAGEVDCDCYFRQDFVSASDQSPPLSP